MIKRHLAENGGVCYYEDVVCDKLVLTRQSPLSSFHLGRPSGFTGNIMGRRARLFINEGLQSSPTCTTNIYYYYTSTFFF